MIRPIALSFLLCWAAVAAQLSIPAVNATVGAGVSVTIQFAAQGSQITGVQFDLQADPNLVVAASLGAPASDAGKALSTADLGQGSRRFLIAGLNQNTIGDGVLVTLNISIPASGNASKYSLHLANSGATDKNGQSIALSVTDGAIALGSGAVDGLSSAGAFAHIASGGGWKTTFTVLNLDTSPTKVRLNLWDDNGNPLSLPVIFPQSGGPAPVTTSSLDRTIGVGQMYVVETEASNLQTGWAELLSSGSVNGFAVFRYRSPQTHQDTEALVPLDYRVSPAYLLPFDNTAGFLTGIALVNPTSSAASVTATWTDESGNQVGVQSISLAPKSHTSFVSTGQFTGSAGLRGVVAFSVPSGAQVAVLGIRGNPFGSFTSSPAFTK